MHVYKNTTLKYFDWLQMVGKNMKNIQYIAYIPQIVTFFFGIRFGHADPESLISSLMVDVWDKSHKETARNNTQNFSMIVWTTTNPTMQLEKNITLISC